MCGIAGIAGLGEVEPPSENLLQKMAQAMAHRGPDGEGVFLKGKVGLAHRRLAIIDPSPAGSQPMVSPDRNLAVVFNGTIYNFRELRSELEKQGHLFKSQCDTEVLLHGWKQWGEDLVPRLNGHFAFAVTDHQKGMVHLIRDRFGVKPLYLAKLGKNLVFASEIKAITAHPLYTAEVNHQALAEYFTFQNLFRYHTLFKGVDLLPAANIMTINTRTGEIKRRAYWDYNFSNPDQSMGQEEAICEVKRLLIQATKRQLVADVPVGAYLSGGMDSGSLVAIASRELNRMHTFTCGWHMGSVHGVEASFDERVQAELMSYLFKTEHFEQIVGHTDVGWALPLVVNHLEDLRLGMSYGQYYAARLASKFVKVCLSGAGGDELFGGYPWRYYRVSHSLGKKEFFDNYFSYWQRLIPKGLRQSFFTPAAKRHMEGDDMRRVLTRVFTFHSNLAYETPEDHIANSLYFEAKTFLHGLFLVGDKLSMANGLEERFPFMDNDLVDFAQKIPVRYKLRDLEEWKHQDENAFGKKKSYFQTHDDGKNILRQAMSLLVPKEVSERKKQGFSSPDESWFREGNLELVKRLILRKGAMCHDYISPRVITEVMEAHCRCGINLRLLIWSLVNFELWLQLFMGKAGDYYQSLGLDEMTNELMKSKPPSQIKAA